MQLVFCELGLIRSEWGSGLLSTPRAQASGVPVGALPFRC